jgi:hypothetical protein
VNLVCGILNLLLLYGITLQLHGEKQVGDSIKFITGTLFYRWQRQWIGSGLNRVSGSGLGSGNTDPNPSKQNFTSKKGKNEEIQV